MSYRPTDLCLLKGFWKFLNFKHDCNFPSEYTVQSNFSSPWLYVATTTETQAHQVILLVKWAEIIQKKACMVFLVSAW